MAYKKYIKRDGKAYGPYIYHSRKINGKVKTEYLGKSEKKSHALLFVIALSALVLFLSAYMIFGNSPYVKNLESAISRSFNSITGFAVEDENLTEPVSSDILNDMTQDSGVTDNVEISDNGTLTNDNSNITETINDTNTNDIIDNSPIINETSNETAINETNENDTGIIDTNITSSENITNEVNFTGNITIIENRTETANAAISTIQLTPQITLNQPVKWKKTVSSDETGNVTVTIPEEAEKINVKKIKDNLEEDITSEISITGAIIGSRKSFIADFFSRLFGAISGKAVDESGSEEAKNEKEIEIEVEADEVEADYEIEYETPAPYAIETEKADSKEVKIIGPETVHYENVLAFTELNEELNIMDASSVKIKWINNYSYVPVQQISDKNENGVYDHIEWLVPRLSNQTFEIIVITKAEHLDSNREFISDIYDKVKAQDDIWSETINDGEYVRVTFETPLDSTRDITIYSRIASGSPTIEVYEVNGTEIVAEFTSISNNEYNKILLTNLLGEQSTFDLRVAGGSVEFDHIIDPSNIYLINADSFAGAATGILATAENGGKNIVRTNANGLVAMWINAVGTDPVCANSTTSGATWGALASEAGTETGVAVASNGVGIIYTGMFATNGAGDIAYIHTPFSACNTTGTYADVGLMTTNYRPDVTYDGAHNRYVVCSIGSSSFDVGISYATPSATMALTWTATNVSLFATTSTSCSIDTNDMGNVFIASNEGASGIRVYNSSLGTFAGYSTMKIAYAAQVSSMHLSTRGNTTLIAANDTSGNLVLAWSTDGMNWNNATYTGVFQGPEGCVDTNDNFHVVYVNGSGLSYVRYTTVNGFDNPENLANSGTEATPSVRCTNFPSNNRMDSTDLEFVFADVGTNVYFANITVDTTTPAESVPPIASFGENPVDTYNSSSSSVTFDLKISDNTAVDRLILYGNWTGTWHANQTNSSPINNTFWNVTVAGIPEGTWKWAVWGNDTTGNSDFTDTNRTLTVDTTNPTSAINAPANGTWTNDTTPAISFTITDNIDSSITYNLWVNGSINKTGSVANATSTNVTLDGQPEGVRLIIAEAVDDSGRAANSSALYLKIDSISPQINFSTGTEENATTKNQQFIFANVSLTEINFKNITFTLQNTTGIVNRTTYTSLVTQINWTNLDNNNVQYWYNASVYDSAENYNKTETRFITLISNQAPNITIFYPVNATTYNVNVSQLNYSASDDTAPAFCWYSINRGTTNSTPSASCSNFTGLTSSQGINNWTVYVNDSAGLEDTDSVTFTKDTVAPSVTINSPANATYNTNSIIFNVTSTDATLSVGSCWYSLDNGATNTTLVKFGATDFYNKTNSSMIQGSQTARFYCNDTIANLNTTQTVTFFIDSVYPLIEYGAQTPANNSNLSQNFIYVDVSVTEANFANITYRLFNSAGPVNVTTYTSQILGINWTALSNERYTFNATVADTVSNQNSTGTRNITLDTAKPSIAYNPTTDANNSFLSRNWVIVNVSATDTNLHSVRLNWNGANESFSANAGSNYWSNKSGLSDGNYTFYAWANDSAGNMNQTGARTVLTDTGAPLVSIIYPQNTTYSTNVSQLNYTVSDSTLASCWYSINAGATNSSPSATCSNITGLISNEGSNTWNIYANDTSGNINSSSRTFSKDTVFPQLTNYLRSPSSPNEDQSIQVNVTVTETNIDDVILEFNNGTSANRTVTTDISSEYYFTINTGNYTAHDSITYYWYANDTVGNTNKSSQQSFTVANQAPSVSAPAINDTTPGTSEMLSCNGGVFSDSDAEDTEQTRYFIWYDNDIEISGQTSQTLALTVSGLNVGDVVKCSARVYDGYDNSTWTNSSNTATIQNSAPSITNALITVSWNANGTAFTYQYSASDDDSDTIVWYDNTTLFDINSTGYITDTPAESEDGIYAIRISASDGTANATDDFSYTINDVTNPATSIVYPQNASYTVNVSQLNFTYTETNPHKCWYSKNGGATNLSIQACTANFTGITSAEGSNTWRVYMNDTSGNVNSSSVTFNKDTAVPAVTINSPLNQTYATNSITFNVTATDGGGISSCLYSLTGGSANYSLANSAGNYWTATNSSMIQGSLTARFYCNDTLNNWNSTQQVVFFIDSINPLISFTGSTETNGTTTARNWVFAEVSVTEANEHTITFSLYNSTSLVNSTNYRTSVRTINWTSLPNANYRYNASVNDTVSNRNTTEARFITLDTQGPTVSDLTESPADPATFSEGANYQFNATIVDPSLDDVFFEFNGTNYTPTSYPGNVYNVTRANLAANYYVYRWYANDTFSNINGSANGTYTINKAAPSLTLTLSPSASETYGTETNVTGSGCSSQLACNLYRNSTSVSNSDVATLAAGLYTYTYNTTGNANYTSASSSQNLTISKNAGACGVIFSQSSPLEYGNSFTASTNCTSAFTFYRNGTSVSNGSLQELGVGAYNFTVIRTDAQNYSNVYHERTFVISQATGLVYTYLGDSRANKTIEQYTAVYLNGTLQNGSGTIKLYNNGTLINQGNSPLSNLTNFTVIGLYNITAIYGGNENYTGDTETWWLTVSEVDTTSPQINLTSPLNKSYSTVQTLLNYTASDNIGLSACWYSLDNGATNTTITCGQNVSGLDSGQGSSTWRAYANDSRGNYNSSAVVFFVDSVEPTISLESPSETNASQLTRDYIYVNVTASDTNLHTITISLYNSSNWLLRANYSAASPFFVNYTGLSAGTYYFNATANDTLNNQASTETRTVSLITPALEITRPENKTYLTNISLPLNFTASDYDSVWYKVDSGANTIITANTTFNVSSGDGSHTLYLYANNSNGEANDNVTFTVNSTRFTIHYSNYHGNGSTTNLNSSSYEDVQNLTGIILENEGLGIISFNEAINLTNDSNSADNTINLDDYINISSNFIEINSTALPNFNKSATITFYNLGFSNPRVLRNAELCPDSICTEVSYSGGTFVFNVTQFTSYSAEETPVTAGGTAGDTGGSGGGGGSSGIRPAECTNNSQCTDGKTCWSGKCVKLFDVKITDFKSPAKLGDFFEFTYYIKGQAAINGDVIVNFWIEKDGEKVTTGSDTIYLGSFDEKTETTKIFLPTTIESGVYRFYVEVDHEAYQASSYRTIQIEVKDGVATITAEGTDAKIYIIFGLVVLVLVLLFIIHLRRDRIKQGKSIERKPKTAERITEIKPKFERIVEKPVAVEQKEEMPKEPGTGLANKLWNKIRTVLSQIKYWFTSIKAKYKSGMYKAQIAAIEEDLGIFRKILDKIHVAFLRIKYGITSIKPKYEAGLYKKEISSIRQIPGGVLSTIAFKHRAPRRSRRGKRSEAIIKPKKGPKTAAEIIEELKREINKKDDFQSS